MWSKKESLTNSLQQMQPFIEIMFVQLAALRRLLYFGAINIFIF